MAIEAEVSPRQMVDFVLGILCIDICDDDSRNRRRVPGEAPPPASVGKPPEPAGALRPAD